MGIIELSTLRVSTHTLQVECDVFGYSYNMSYSCFNSHTPLEKLAANMVAMFQLTHSKWSVIGTAIFQGT